MYFLIYVFPTNRNQLNTVLDLLLTKVDQYRTCIQSNNTKMVGVVELHVFVYLQGPFNVVRRCTNGLKRCCSVCMRTAVCH